MGRDTGTGSAFERVLSDALTRRGIAHATQQNVGAKPGGGTHRIDCVINGKGTNGTDLLVSCKTQNVSGTAEEKVVYEVVKLLHALKAAPLKWGSRAVLVMDGAGWSHAMRKFIEEELVEWVPASRDRIAIYRSADAFIEAEL